MSLIFSCTSNYISVCRCNDFCKVKLVSLPRLCPTDFLGEHFFISFGGVESLKFMVWRDDSAVKSAYCGPGAGGTCL